MKNTVTKIEKSDTWAVSYSLIAKTVCEWEAEILQLKNTRLISAVKTGVRSMCIS